MQKIFLSVIVLLLGSNAFGQDNYSVTFEKEQSVYLYVNPLYNTSILKSEIECDCGSKSLEFFEAGGFYKNKITSHFSYEVGLEYRHTLIEYVSFPEGINIYRTVKQDFLSLAVRGNYELSDTFYVQAGILPAYILANTNEYNSSNFSFGLELGLGMNIKIFENWHLITKTYLKVPPNDDFTLGVQFGVGYVW